MSAAPLDPSGAGRQIVPLALALSICALAAATFYGVQQIPTPRFGTAVGPRTFPLIVAVGLAVCGGGLLLQALRRQLIADEVEWGSRRQNILWFVAGLVANLVLIELVGFTLASAAMFTCIARAFGSTRPVRDAMIGTAFALVVYLAFRFLLGVNIGNSPLGELW
jgi:putative tricarboxylic transport membrane protein